MQNGLIFLAVTAIYHFLYVLGSSFYSFQWDILLIETGFQPWRGKAQVAGASHSSAGLKHHHLSGLRMKEAVQICSGAAAIEVSREPDREGLQEALS